MKQPSDEERSYLWDMLKAAKRAVSYVDGIDYDTFIADSKTYDAVERAIEIVGQAAKETSREFQEQQPQIDWRAIIGLRNMLAHEYGEIIQERIWKVAIVYVPDLITKLEALLGDE